MNVRRLAPPWAQPAEPRPAGPVPVKAARRLFEQITEGTTTRSERYVRTVFQNLATFRFITFSMGAALEFSTRDPEEVRVAHVVLAVAVGLYNFVRVLWPFNPAGKHRVVQGLVIVSDVALGLSLVLATDGLESGFLIYSLAPILAVSLLMDGATAIAVAAASALSITGAYLFSGLGLGDYPWILDGNFLVFSFLYTAICLLVAALPFVANLNWHLRVRTESMDAERLRLRREVHDNIAQTMAFLNLKVKRAQERASDGRVAMSERDVTDIARAVERAYLTVRDYLDGATEAGATGAFGASMKAVVSQWGHDTGLHAEVAVEGQDAQLAPQVQAQLVQIAREALANVAKHAAATHVRVTCAVGAGGASAVLGVRDDGQGFARSRPTGHGSSIMQERAAMIGARISVTSAPGQGTDVVVSWPAPAEEQA
jgi:signal transduction histidine kinase